MHITTALNVEGYFLLGLISSLVFRAVRDALPHDPVAQEKIVRASLTALAIADVRAFYCKLMHVHFWGLTCVPFSSLLYCFLPNCRCHSGCSVMVFLAAADCGTILQCRAVVDWAAFGYQGKPFIMESNDTWQCNFYDISVPCKVSDVRGHSYEVSANAH
jgi:hypothetical protein